MGCVSHARHTHRQSARHEQLFRLAETADSRVAVVHPGNNGWGAANTARRMPETGLELPPLARGLK